MKKAFGILICFVVIMVCAFALADVAINEKNFPDENFRAYVSENCDTDWDGKLSDEEINATHSINCNEKEITVLKGIEHFTALTLLECVGNQLTTLDVSKNTALTALWCYDNQLTKLDVSKNTALTVLYCLENQLTKLDVSKNTALIRLNCTSNQLTQLDVSKNTALTALWCGDNQLTKLDVSKNAALTRLNCNRNQLTKLDVSKCTDLAKLVKATAPKTDASGYYGWWTDDGSGNLDGSKPYLFVDKTVKVIPASQIKVTSITLSKTKATLKMGKTLQLKVKKILPADATDKTVTWKSSNKKVATVDSKGKVKAVGKGTCTITCTAKDGSKVKAKCKITVK